METKRFIGNDMRRLYERVRDEFGPDAIIVRTRSLMRDGAEPLIELLAAPPHAEPELALDLQWQMVDGALGRLQIARPRPTVGDLEDIAAREGAIPLPQLPPPGAAEPPEWLEGFVAPADNAPPPPPRATAGGLRHIPFEGLDGIEDETPPPHEWASRPRPAMARAGVRPAAPVIDFAPGPAASSLDEALAAAGMTRAAIERVLRSAHGEPDPVRALAATLASFEVRYPDDLQTAIVTIQGAPGSGRTTALMRMALDCADADREAILVAADTTRAAAREQLYAYADATGLPVFDAPDPAQLSALAARSRRGACLFVDVPAGPFAPPQVLGDVHYTYLALPAHWQAGVLERRLRGFAMATFSGCVITGSDLATEMSPVVSQVVQSGLGVAFLSSGRDISTGIETADPLAIASGILRETSGDRTDGRLAATA